MECPAVMIVGTGAGAGKSTVCLAIIQALLQNTSLKADEIAYIKPCTQCEGVQLVSKFCHRHGITHRGIGPVVYVHGFTCE